MKTIILSACLCLQLNLFSQQFYQFVQTSSTYAELVDDSVITAPNFADDLLTVISLDGETFAFFDTNYVFDEAAYFAIQTNGNLRIENAFSAVIIDGLFTNLDSIDENTKLSWKIEGEPGYKIIKAQWKNIQLGFGEEGNFVNFQFWIYQETGIIEIHYGPRSDNNASGFTDNGPNVGIFQSNTSFSDIHEKLWIAGNPESPDLDSNQTFTFPRLTGVPEEGTIYRLVPKHLTLHTEQTPEFHSLTLFPNPTVNQLNVIIGSNNTLLDLTVFDANGKRVQNAISITENSIDLSELPDGNYLIHLNTEKGLIKRKIVLQR